MLALAHFDADQCSGCGNQLSITTAEDRFGRPKHRFKVPLPPRCHACTELAKQQEDYKDSPQPGALLWSTTTDE